MVANDKSTVGLLDRAGRGCPDAAGELFVRNRDRLRRLVQLRLDHRLQGRLDESDVLQEIYLEYSRCLSDYLRNPVLPFFLWLRYIAGMKLQAVHRQHLGVKARDPRREVSLGGALPQASSICLAAQLLGKHTSPSQAAVRVELQLRVQEALNAMDPIDREVLALRHFEQLTNSETAQLLGLSEAAASNRFVRALKRLRDILMQTPGLADYTAQVRSQ
jgi:RNA polymerase sigma-70 factor (ECF subfamily)